MGSALSKALNDCAKSDQRSSKESKESKESKQAVSVKKDLDAVVTNIKSNETSPITTKAVLDTKSSEPVLPDSGNKPLAKLNQDNKSTVEFDKFLSNSNIEEAVIKIQAGIRGYLTRKQLKQNLNKNLEPTAATDDHHSNILNVAKNTLTKFLDDTLPDVKVEVKTDEKETKEDGLNAVNVIKTQNVTTSDDSSKSEKEKSGSILDGKMIEKVVNIIQDSIDTSNGVNVNVDSKYLNLPKIQQKLIDDAATKIQAVFRGYQVRKSISRGGSPSRPKQNTDEGAKTVNDNEQNEKIGINLKDVNLDDLKEKESLDALHKLDDALSQGLLSTDQVTDSSKQDISVESLTFSTNDVLKDPTQSLDIKDYGKDSMKMNISPEMIDSKVKSFQENLENTQTSLKPEHNLSNLNTSTVEIESNLSDLKLTTQEKDPNETSFKDTMTEKINVSEIDELSQKTSKVIKDLVSPVPESLELKTSAMEDVEKEVQKVQDNINKSKEMIESNIQEGIEKVKDELIQKLDQDVNEFANDVSISSQKEDDLKYIDTSGATNSSFESNLKNETESPEKPKESSKEKSPQPRPPQEQQQQQQSQEHSA